MNLEQIITYQKKQLQSHNIVHKLWSKIRGKAVEIGDAEEHVFQKHFPLQLEEFFGECVSKAKYYLEQPSNDLFETLDYKYLCSLIYFMLTRTELEGSGENIRLLIHVSSLYLVLNCLPASESTIFFNEIYTEAVKVFDFIKTSNYKEPPVLMLLDDLRMFLTKSETILNQQSLLITISSLADFIFTDNTTVFENFDEGRLNDYGGKPAYLAFLCYTAIVKRDYPKKLEMANARLTTLLSLMNCFKSNIAPIRMLSVCQKNVQNFIHEISPLLMVDDEYLISKAVKVIIPKQEYDCYEGIVVILKNLPIEEYQAFIQWTACAMVSNNQSYKRYFPNIAVFIMKNPPDPAQFSKCEVAVELLTQNIIKLIADPSDNIRENAIKNLEELLKLNDAFVKIAIRRILSREDKLNAKTILIVIRKNADLKWTKPVLNQRIINIICQFIVLRDDYFLTQQTMEVLLSLCFAANPTQLKPCISNLHALIEAFLTIADNVAKSVISIFVHQLDKDNSSVFTKELWRIVFGEVNAKKHKMETWSTATLLLSQNFNVDKIFQKFTAEKLLDVELVHNLINFVHGHDIAWKLLSVVCKHVKFNDWFKIERYILHSLTTKTFSNSTVHMFRCLNSMLENKTVNSDQEMTSLQTILSHLCNNFVSLAFPLHCMPASVELISTISNLTGTFPNWTEDAMTVLNGRLKQALGYITSKTLESVIEIERDLAYTAELVAFSRNSSISEENLATLKRIVDPELQSRSLTEFLTRYSTVWTQCLILYSKVMLLTPEKDSREISEVLQKCLCCSDPHVQLCALYALYDLCHICLEYFDPIVPYLFALIDQNNASVRFASTKIIIECVDKEVIQLKDGHFLLFVSLLMDSDLEVKKTVMKYIKFHYSVKNERNIAQHFVSAVFHLNHYHDHPLLQLTPSETRMLDRRRFLHSELSETFSFLFQHLSKKTQFNIIEQLTKEVLVSSLSDLESYCFQAEKVRVLENALLLIIKLAFMCETITGADNRTFYEESVKLQFKKLFEPRTNHPQKPQNKIHHRTIKFVLKTLWNIMEKIERVHSNILELVFRAFIIFTRGFFDDIKEIVFEDTTLKHSYEQFMKFHQSESSQFKYEQKLVHEDNDFFYEIDL